MGNIHVFTVLKKEVSYTCVKAALERPSADLLTSAVPNSAEQIFSMLSKFNITIDFLEICFEYASKIPCKKVGFFHQQITIIY